MKYLKIVDGGKNMYMRTVNKYTYKLYCIFFGIIK